MRNELEIDRDVWEAMNENERDEAARDEMFNMIEWNWREKVDDNE